MKPGHDHESISEPGCCCAVKINRSFTRLARSAMPAFFQLRSKSVLSALDAANRAPGRQHGRNPTQQFAPSPCHDQSGRASARGEPWPGSTRSFAGLVQPIQSIPGHHTSSAKHRPIQVRLQNEQTLAFTKFNQSRRRHSRSFLNSSMVPAKGGGPFRIL